MVNRDTEDFNNEYCDSNGNRARVVRLLKERGLPKDGWYCESWEDMGNADNRCELCGIDRVRYVHHMHNVITNDHLAVGCYCAGGMENDLSAAVERERSNVNRLKRKNRFLSKRWFEGLQSGKHIWTMDYKGYRLKIMRSSSGWYGYKINGWKWCRNYLRTFDSARDALFDDLDRLTS